MVRPGRVHRQPGRGGADAAPPGHAQLMQIAERQFLLMFLNSAIDGLALICSGLGLAVGLFNGGDRPPAHAGARARGGRPRSPSHCSPPAGPQPTPSASRRGGPRSLRGTHVRGRRRDRRPGGASRPRQREDLARLGRLPALRRPRAVGGLSRHRRRPSSPALPSSRWPTSSAGSPARSPAGEPRCGRRYGGDARRLRRRQGPRGRRRRALPGDRLPGAPVGGGLAYLLVRRQLVDDEAPPDRRSRPSPAPTG